MNVRRRANKLGVAAFGSALRANLAPCALLSLFLTGCGAGGAPPASPASEEQQKNAPEKAQQKGAALPMPQGKEVSFEQELARVSEIRGLSAQGPLRGLEVGREELLAHVIRAVELEMPEKALIGTEAMLVGLGLVPADFDYHATMLELLSSKLAGLYDPHLKAMLIRAGLSPADRQMTLLHELVHALQDQHYDVMEVVEWAPDDTDRSGALSALAEGDATSAMFDGMMTEGKTALSLPPGFIQERMRADGDAPEGVPSIIHRSLKASYIDGLTFVHELRSRGGFTAVDAAWKRPPKTTEQILHLEKYDTGEEPLPVAVPAPPSKDFELILHDSWGEQNLRLVFEEWMSLDDASRAASGWGGDRIVAYRSPSVSLTVWQLRADDDVAAARYFSAFSEGYAEDRVALDSKEQSCGRRTPGGPVTALLRSGRDVLVSGSPLGSSEPTRAQCLAAIEYLRSQL
jgi:hypothetical protein